MSAFPVALYGRGAHRTSVVLDFAGQLKGLQASAMAYSDLSVEGRADEAAEGLFRALRWAERQQSAQRLLIAGACCVAFIAIVDRSRLLFKRDVILHNKVCVCQRLLWKTRRCCPLTTQLLTATQRTGRRAGPVHKNSSWCWIDGSILHNQRTHKQHPRLPLITCRSVRAPVTRTPELKQWRLGGCRERSNLSLRIWEDHFRRVNKQDPKT